MKITYDKNIDAMRILFSGSDIEETRDIAPGVYVDYDTEGRMVGLEILKASQKYDLGDIEFQAPDRYMSLSDAGRLYGLSPTTLRHQIGKGVLKGKKFGRNWMVRNDHIADYVRERSRKAGKSKEETHRIRQGGSERKPLSEKGFGTALHEIFKSVGGVDLEIPERDAMRELPRFD